MSGSRPSSGPTASRKYRSSSGAVVRARAARANRRVRTTATAYSENQSPAETLDPQGCRKVTASSRAPTTAATRTGYARRKSRTGAAAASSTATGQSPWMTDSTAVGVTRTR